MPANRYPTKPSWASVLMVLVAAALLAGGMSAETAKSGVYCVKCMKCAATFDLSGAAQSPSGVPSKCPKCGFVTVVHEDAKMVVHDWSTRIPCDPKPPEEKEFPLSGALKATQEISPPARYLDVPKAGRKGGMPGIGELWDRMMHRGSAIHRLELSVGGVPSGVDVFVRLEIDPPSRITGPGRRVLLQDGKAVTTFEFKPPDNKGVTRARAYYPASIKLVGKEYKVSEKEESVEIKIKSICPRGSSVYYANDLISDISFDKGELQDQLRQAIEEYGVNNVSASAYTVATLGWFLANPGGRGPFGIALQYYTGKEIALHRFVTNQGAKNPLTPGDLFKKALELNSGDMTQALLTCHNVVRSSSRGAEEFPGLTPEELELLSRKTKLSKQELLKRQEALESMGQFANKEIFNCLVPLRPGGDNEGAWYHLFGTATMSLATQSNFIVDNAVQFPTSVFTDRPTLDRVIWGEEYLVSSDIYSDPNEYCADVMGLELGDYLRSVLTGARRGQIADNVRGFLNKVKDYAVQGARGMGTGSPGPVAVYVRCPMSAEIVDRATGRYFRYDQDKDDVSGDLALAFGLEDEGNSFGVIAYLPGGDLDVRCRALDKGSFSMHVVDLQTNTAASYENLAISPGDELRVGVPYGNVRSEMSGSRLGRLEPSVKEFSDETVERVRDKAERYVARERGLPLDGGGGQAPSRTPEPPRGEEPPRAETPRPPAPPPDAADARVEPTLELSKKRLAPGEEFRISFTARRSYPANAWIGILPRDVPHGSEAVNDQHDLAFGYMAKKASGEIVLRAPNQPGEYDIRMHDGDDNGKEVASIPFKVVAPDKPEPPRGAEGSGNTIKANEPPKPEKGAVKPKPPAATPIPEPPPKKAATDDAGSAKNDGAPAVSVNKQRYFPGEEIRVSFKALKNFSANAWFGVVPSQVPHGDEGANGKAKLAFEVIGGRTEGEIVLKAPDAPGDYDVRMHNRGKGGKEVASVSFRVAKRK